MLVATPCGAPEKHLKKAALARARLWLPVSERNRRGAQRPFRSGGAPDWAFLEWRAIVKAWLYRSRNYKTACQKTFQFEAQPADKQLRCAFAYHGQMPSNPAFFCPARPCCARAPFALGLCLAAVLLLGGCSSVGVGIGVPLGPFTLGVGTGSGGPSLGLGTGIGPFGAGVGVNTSGQVSGNVGVGASVPIGGSAARAGVGVGTGAVLYDPRNSSSNGSRAPVAQPGMVVPRAAAGDNDTPRY